MFTTHYVYYTSPFYNFAVKLSQHPPVVSQLYMCDPAKTNSKTSCNVMPVTRLGNCEDEQFVLLLALLCFQHQGRTDCLSNFFLGSLPSLSLIKVCQEFLDPFFAPQKTHHFLL